MRHLSNDKGVSHQQVKGRVIRLESGENGRTRAASGVFFVRVAVPGTVEAVQCEH